MLPGHLMYTQTHTDSSSIGFPESEGAFRSGVGASPPAKLRTQLSQKHPGILGASVSPLRCARPMTEGDEDTVEWRLGDSGCWDEEGDRYPWPGA